MKIYRPLSNLTFISTVVESSAVDHLQAHDQLPRLQSTYWRHHSTDKALLCASSLPHVTHRQGVTLLGLLDLSAAFDCVDDILLCRLQQSFGIRCTVLNARPDQVVPVRTQRVCYAGRLSFIVQLHAYTSTLCAWAVVVSTVCHCGRVDGMNDGNDHI